jgi:hypothetical protein
MKGHPRITGSVALVVASTLVVAVLFPPHIRAQGGAYRRFAGGSDCLRWLLKTSNFDPIGDLRQLTADPRHTILIALGSIDWLDSEGEAGGIPGGLESYIERGGVLLAASDVGSGGQVQRLTGARIDGAHVMADERTKGSCYRKQLDCPFVLPQMGFRAQFDNPCDGLHVATNIPSYLTIRPEGLPEGAYLLGHLPNRVQRVGDGGPGVYDRAKLSPQFAVGGVRGQGRFLLLADHSIFINEMLLAEDCDNFAFTVRCLDWLAAEGDRTRAMLVADGMIFPDFSVTLRPPPSVPPLKVLEAMYARRDEIVDKAQESLAEWENRANRSVVGGPGRRAENRMFWLRRYALWAFGGCLAAVLIYRVSHAGRFLPERRLPFLGAAIAGQLPARPLPVQRQYEQVGARNLWESARTLARQRLAAIAAASNTKPVGPRTSRNWRQRRSARLRLERLQTIAYGPAPVRIAPDRWEKFLADLDAFDRDVADGTVKLPAV